MPEPRDRPIEARQIPSWVPFFNLLAKPLLKLGVPMGPDVLITVRGRKTDPEEAALGRPVFEILK